MEEPKATGKVQNFLKAVPPFHLLPNMALQELVLTLTIEHFSAGEIILRPDGAPTQFLYLIRSGGVKFLISDPQNEGGEKIIDIRGEKEFFGIYSLLTDRPSPFKIVAENDSVCYLLKKEVFTRVLEKHVEVLLYFTMGPSKGFKPGASAKSTAATDPPGMEADHLLFSTKVRDIMHRQVLTCLPAETIVEAARRMTKRGVGSLIVVDPEQQPIGIVTDGDLRKKVIASGQLDNRSVEAIMSAPLKSIPPDSFYFEAVISMIRNRIKYLPVMEEDELVGILSERDLMISQGNNPVALIRQIHQAPDLDQLVVIHKDITRTMKVMLERGGQAKEICELITQLNDHLAYKIIRLGEEALVRQGRGSPPVEYIWMALGSEGRQEQTLSTDQDNALVFADVEPSRESEVQAYFLDLAEQVVSGLERCGFPRCTGDMMASNPKWCQPLRTWKDYYRKWITTRDLSAQDILISSIFFDHRTIYGPEDFLKELTLVIKEAVGQSRTFLPNMALRSLETRPPLGFFNRLIVEKSGEYKNMLNLKLHGFIPLVDAVRILALEQSLTKTNTLERIQGLTDKGVFPGDDGRDLYESFNLLMLLRFRHHLDQMNRGRRLDNYINPSALTQIQRSMLKSAFKAIDRLQNQIEIRFGLTALRQR
jgi:CBS domain-containing protein